MFRRILIVLAIILASCSPSKDDFKATRHDYNFTVKMVYASPEQTAKNCSALGLTEVNGCNTFNLDTKVCTIYVAPQRYTLDDERLVIMGHELDHCAHGKWHK